jgi:pantoate--beta-alanine ligase
MKPRQAEVISSSSAMQRTSLSLRGEGRTIGVVPTMGALHEGHLALIRKAREMSDVVITTIFINPLQFGKSEDLSRYPRSPEQDAELASEAGTDLIFSPPEQEIYPQGYATSVEVEGVTRMLEGKARPSHFKGVTTVVAKLFNITLPTRAFFGQKDAQQVVVVKRMARDLNFPVEIVVVPTVRGADGLALSSRNVYLSEAERREAPVLYRALQHGARQIIEGVRDCEAVRKEMIQLITSQSSGLVDYVSIADDATLEECVQAKPGRTLLLSLAVRFGQTRLIDNMTVIP